MTHEIMILREWLREIGRDPGLERAEVILDSNNHLPADPARG